MLIHITYQVLCSKVFVLVGIMILFVFGSCTDKGHENTTTAIHWDDWGVPHIEAISLEEMFYSYGWAQMQMHPNLILKLYGSSRGRAAEYWGEQYLSSDVIIHTLDFPAIARHWQEQQTEQFGTYIDAFVGGLNDFAEHHPEMINDDMKAILPISSVDAFQHMVFILYGRFVAGGDLGQSQRWQHMGSNTYAIAPKRSANGHAMLVQNPHLPWSDEFTWFEADLSAPGYHLYGASLVGTPVLEIAFDDNHGWSHTNNTIDPADLYELTLTENGYRLDGEERSFDRRTMVLKVKTEDGVSEQQIEMLTSVHGPVVAHKDNKALAIRFNAMDYPHAIEQWWDMGRAKNFEEFETALQQFQIPFFNVMYADRDGHIFYYFNGHVPKRAEGGWSFWRGVVPGDQSKYIWDEVHGYGELPKIKNPDTGWLQNANDPPWTCTLPSPFNRVEFPEYLAPSGMSFRPQRAARMLMEDDEITYNELVDYKLSTRMETADRLMDDLNAAVEQYGSDKAKEALEILNAWDRQAERESKGAVLFTTWFDLFGKNGAAGFKVPWSPDRANETPDGIRDPEKAVLDLEQAASLVMGKYGQLNVGWGEVHRLRRGDLDLPGNGGSSQFGIFRITNYQEDTDGKYSAMGGDSWVSVIEFGEKVIAKVLLSYGNSTNPESPHYGDQLRLFSEKKLRDAWFYSEDLLGHVTRVEKLAEKGFVE